MNNDINLLENFEKSLTLLKSTAKTSTIIDLDEGSEIPHNEISTDCFPAKINPKQNINEEPYKWYQIEEEISDDEENSSSKPNKRECLTGLGVACRINAAKITNVRKYFFNLIFFKIASSLILPVCLVVDIYRIGRAVKKDFRSNIGLKRTPVVTASVAGSWMGAFAGGYTVGKAGSVIGGI